MEQKKVIERIIWSVAVVVCVLTITVLARAEFGRGEPPHPPPSPEKMIEQLQKDFNLTREQTARVREFMAESAQREEEVLKRYGLNREQFQVLQKDLHMAKDDFLKKMDFILTDEQKKACGMHGGRHGDGHVPPPPPDKPDGP